MSSAAVGRLPLVLLHGLSDSSASWPSVVARYGGEREIVSLDAPGHGGEPLPDGPFSVQALGEAAVRQLRACDLGPAVLLGHSMGGITAEAVALIAPDLVAALVLEDPAWVDLPPGDAPDWLASVVEDYAGRPVEELRAAARREVADWPVEDQQAWAEAKRLLDPGLLAGEHRWSDRDWLREMAGVRVPVTLLTGDNGFSVVTAQMVEQVAAALGRAPEGLLTHAPVHGVGHNIRREAPERFLEILDAALARADAAQPGTR